MWEGLGAYSSNRVLTPEEAEEHADKAAKLRWGACLCYALLSLLCVPCLSFSCALLKPSGAMFIGRG